MSPVTLTTTGFSNEPPRPTVAEYPFARYADARYPLLRIAAANQHPAHSVKVEWLVDGDNGRETWANYTQILRTPFTPDEDGDRALYVALEQHLRDTENVLWFGTPSYNVGSLTPLGTCGGALHYLGRPPLHADRIALRVLRDCVLLRNRRPENSPKVVNEFLSEFSLEITPAPGITPHRVAEPKAWRQGSSLWERDAA